ncbi:MAG: hypothetical protein HQ565_12580 [Bacteroidetes bacterium]|nr:hypothetical protein [Bacteroidota bacterium]
MKELIIETIGHIEKKETLTSIGYSDLVLESLYPFPGYHGTTVPDQDSPRSVFLMTKSSLPEERIIRAIKAVKQKTRIEFDGTPALVSYQKAMVQCIRIKDLENYEKIPEILKAYKDEGISFQSGKKVDPYSSIIKVTKYFLLKPITDCTLQDAEDVSMKYFQVAVKLNWDQFEEMTLHVKRNMEDSNWDAALATIYRRSGIEDYFRIFNDVNCEIETLNKIRKKYIQEIKKLIEK